MGDGDGDIEELEGEEDPNNNQQTNAILFLLPDIVGSNRVDGCADSLVIVQERVCVCVCVCVNVCFDVTYGAALQFQDVAGCLHTCFVLQELLKM